MIEDKKEIKNAMIKDILIGLTDQNIFTCWLVVSIGNQSQGFGGYDLRLNNSAHDFITGILNVVSVKDTKQLVGRPIRIEHDSTKIYRIGNYIDDNWYTYEKVEFDCSR